MGVPSTSFPEPSEYDRLCESLDPVLIISDARECNANLSAVLKLVADYVQSHGESYHTSSVLALKVLNSNLFVKNYRFCLGKLLMLLGVLGHSESEDATTLRELLSILIVLAFKLTSDETCPSEFQRHIGTQQLMKTLRDLDFVPLWADFVTEIVRKQDQAHSAYVLLKFNCDSFFQYLYHVVVLSENELHALANTELVPLLVDSLLTSSIDFQLDEFDNVPQLIAYEHFKLLLLINEQYMMSSTTKNQVVDALVNRKHSANGVCGFTNFLVYHMNREESHIIKILMLKFLYLVFSAPNSAGLAYLNDLKILVDIFIRELNNLDYNSPEHLQENHVLALTYLKVLYPLLTSTQLNDLPVKYKPFEILELLSNVIVNCDGADSGSGVNPQVIAKAATKCFSIPWLKASKNAISSVPVRLYNNRNPSNESVNSVSSVNSRSKYSVDSSTESLAFARIASVQSSSIGDFNKHTTSHNLEMESPDEERSSPTDNVRSNNHNVFLDAERIHSPKKPLPKLPPSPRGNVFSRGPEISSKHTMNLLDLPKEYISREPPTPVRARKPFNSRAPPALSIQTKARQKKAPPPPPPPPRRRN